MEDKNQIMFATRLGVATKDGFILISYSSKTMLYFDEIKNLTLYKNILRQFEFLGYLVAIFVLISSYIFFSNLFVFISLVFLAFLVFYYSRFFRIKKYHFLLVLNSGELLKVRLRRREVEDAKRLIKFYRKKKH
jgi:hypothetical protein